MIFIIEKCIRNKAALIAEQDPRGSKQSPAKKKIAKTEDKQNKTHLTCDAKKPKK